MYKLYENGNFLSCHQEPDGSYANVSYSETFEDKLKTSLLFEFYNDSDKVLETITFETLEGVNVSRLEMFLMPYPTGGWSARSLNGTIFVFEQTDLAGLAYPYVGEVENIKMSDETVLHPAGSIEVYALNNGDDIEYPAGKSWQIILWRQLYRQDTSFELDDLTDIHHNAFSYYNNHYVTLFNTNSDYLQRFGILDYHSEYRLIYHSYFNDRLTLLLHGDKMSEVKIFDSWYGSPRFATFDNGTIINLFRDESNTTTVNIKFTDPLLSFTIQSGYFFDPGYVFANHEWNLTSIIYDATIGKLHMALNSCGLYYIYGSDMGRPFNVEGGYLLGYNETNHVAQIKATNRTVTVSYDAVLPTLSITYPSNGSYLSSSNVKTVWSGFDAMSGINHYQVRLDDSRWINLGTDTTYTFSEVCEGSHRVEVKAIDKASLTREVSIHFVVNTSLIGGFGWIDDVAFFIGVLVVVLGIAVYLQKIRATARTLFHT